MPRNQPAQVTDEWDGDGGRSAKRRRMMRYAVPAAVVGLTAASIGLVPAFAGSGSPDLPKISAQDLIAKVAASDVQQLSGTVRTNTDLGLPSLSGAGAGAFGGGSSGQGGSGTGDKDGKGASASPQNQLMDLASGSHTLRVAADGPDKQRVSVVGKAAEYNLVHNGRDVWGYDSKSNTAYHSTIPAGAGKDGKHGKHGTDGSGKAGDLKNATPQELAKKALDAVGDSTSVTVDGTAKVAGRDAYQLSVKPKQAGSTVDSIRISVDAETGVPLKFTLTPKGGGAAAIDVGFTSVDFAKPAAGTFDFKPPKGAEVVDGDKARAEQRAKGERTAEDLQGILGQYGLSGKNAAKGKGGVDVIGSGWTSIAHVKGAGSGLSSANGKGASGDAAKLLDSLGEKVDGKFGSGRLFSTRLVNALVTDDGSVYAGAVDKESLIKAAESAK
ncbi:LolA family protein [Streptomyces monomycini]|uniref:LolA family protein n=1 Tax=Streptomyces monomycini TaxID=371720 RepID=UPI0004AA188C|nr:outer membrane lipoprotein carrier protein LolA [Streptomyces monomycini]